LVDDSAFAPVRVELQIGGGALGVVSLADGTVLGGGGLSPISLALTLPVGAPLLCVAACARLQVLERFAEPDGGWSALRTVTVGECDAHTEHTSFVTLSLHQPAFAPPELPAGGPVSSSWQLLLDLAVRPRADPHAACSSVSWAHPLRLVAQDDGAPDARARFIPGSAGSVSF
jgi:hypothetical protein